MLQKQFGVVKKFSKYQNLSYDAIKQSILAINVYYEDLNYLVIQETQAYTFDSIIGVIGGQLGLCLGISLLSKFGLS